MDYLACSRSDNSGGMQPCGGRCNVDYPCSITGDRYGDCFLRRLFPSISFDQLSSTPASPLCPFADAERALTNRAAEATGKRSMSTPTCLRIARAPPSIEE